MLDLTRDEQSALSDAESHLIELYRKLIVDDQKQVLRLARLLAEHPEPMEKD
jgi:hypothetical protein